MSGRGWPCLAGVGRVPFDVARVLAIHTHPFAGAGFCKFPPGFHGGGTLNSWVVSGAIVDRHIEPFTEVLDDFCGEFCA